MKSIVVIFIFFLAAGLRAQGVSINEAGTAPHPSAMLDVQSTTKGVLIPRMSTNQRINIATPPKGLIVFDTSTLSFWYRTATDWVELSDNFHGLRDMDKDTKVQVEESPDEDIIRFDIGGVEAMILDESSTGATRLDIAPDSSLIIGHNAGLTTIAGANTILGFEAGQNNTTGNQNVMLGFRAGRNNGANQSKNVFIGYDAGFNNNSSYNTFLGYAAGTANTTGNKNTFLGYQSGLVNISGHDNTLVGYDAGHNNNAHLNTFVGREAGYTNRLGIHNIVIGANAAGGHHFPADMGNENSIVGDQAAYWSTAISGNVLMGYQAGYGMTSAANNALLGYKSGYSFTTGRSNVSMGAYALYSNSVGNYNVSIGDSTLFNNTASGNVALGSKAGTSNTTGSGNTFIGKNAGLSNTTGGFNVMLGSTAGKNTTTGGYNVFIGGEVAASNVGGKNNTFIGYASGFRNVGGDKNIFLGTQAAEYNTNGTSNIGIGTSVLTRNNNGTYNIAIGELALGNPVNEPTSISSNIAIGKNAGRGVVGSHNIIIGNESGINIGGFESVLLGNNIEPHGERNIYIGSETSASIVYNPVEAVAIGYGTEVVQDYSIVVGNPSSLLNKVGMGTATPSARLHVEGQGFEPFKVTQNGSLALQVNTAGTVLAHHELLVNTTTGKPGYQLSVDGSVACEEVLVQDSGNWPDYVFASDYQLMPVNELHSFLQQNQHLPGIPSAAEVSETGVKVGDMQKRLLQKIEELTLYIVDLESRLKRLENNPSSLK